MSTMIKRGNQHATYDNPFQPDSVYGHMLDLLVENRIQAATDAIHLDLGCGYGRVAEPLTARLGYRYVGVDKDQAGLDSLAARGFETHRLVLGEEEETLEALRRIVGDRRVAGVSFLDTLEHLADGDRTLRAIGRFAAEKRALVVISVPNFAHADIAAKLLLGRLDITDVGLLDHTHTRTFTARGLDTTLMTAGLHKVAEKNTRVRHSDQHFPTDHSLLAEGTEIGGLLRSLRAAVDPDHADVMQLVRLCAPGPAAAATPWNIAYLPEQRPFLSVITRTQGRRLHTLRETLLCLHGQTDGDIEVIVIGHKLTFAQLKAVERLIDDQPEEMRARTRLLRINDGGRTRPLNTGFAAATGHYIAILDDDDIPFAHWVETFRELHKNGPGRMLRASCVRQSVRNVTVSGQKGLRAEDTPKRVYPARFDLFEHLRGNRTPPLTIAFPRGAFHDLGIHFDETLTTTEDWDYILRVAPLVGVSSSAAVTSVYRWWETDESSRTLHDQEEWDRNYLTTLRKMDAAPLLLPPASTARLRILLDGWDKMVAANPDRLRDEAENLRAELGRCQAELENCQAELENCQAELENCQAELGNCQAELENCQAELEGCGTRLNVLKTTIEMHGDPSQLRYEIDELNRAIERSTILRVARRVPPPVRRM